MESKIISVQSRTTWIKDDSVVVLIDSPNQYDCIKAIYAQVEEALKNSNMPNVVIIDKKYYQDIFMYKRLPRKKKKQLFGSK